MTASEIKDKDPASTANLAVGRISAGIHSSVAPMISQMLRIIKDLSGQAEVLSVNDLADFISGEPTTMGRIVSIASSIGYNSSGVEIGSVHHAISLIGFDRIRTLAISILLLETAQSEHTAQTNRELASQALVGGLVAAEMCRRGVVADAELAFICGSLRGYGRMLAATFMAEEYDQMLKLSAEEDYETAFETVFGLPSLELGQQILTSMLLPKFILNTFVTLNPQSRRHCSETPGNAVIATAEFGLRAAELLQSPDLTGDNFEPRMEALSREYDSPFALSRSGSREIIHYLVGTLDRFRSSAGSYVGSVAMFRRLECLAEERPLPLPYGVRVIPAARSRKPPELDGSGQYEI